MQCHFMMGFKMELGSDDASHPLERLKRLTLRIGESLMGKLKANVRYQNVIRTSKMAQFIQRKPQNHRNEVWPE